MSLQEPKIEKKAQSKKNVGHFLILFNDNVNTFHHVIESLIDICHHKNEQAEQCAVIAHYIGKCDVKKGSINELKPFKNGLTNRGLNVTIE